MAIERLTRPEAELLLPGLTALLQDAVASGASVGFLPPLSAEEAAAYWREVIAALPGGRVLLVARDGGDVVGTVQLDPARRPNGRHRAEVAKLMVHTSSRRAGIGRALMEAVEMEARALGRTTLVLDTREGDPSEALYRSLGYTAAGRIPAYAHGADGRMDATVFYYKLLG